MPNDLPLRLLSALAIGLLIGAERERRKGEGPFRAAAGIRTFAIVSLIGAVTVIVGNEWLLAIALIAVAGLATAAYLRSLQEDPGLTTETTLILTVLLGGLAVRYPRHCRRYGRCCRCPACITRQDSWVREPCNHGERTKRCAGVRRRNLRGVASCTGSVHRSISCD